MLLVGVAENRFSEENLDYLHVRAPEINLKCLAAIDFGRNTFSTKFQYTGKLFIPPRSHS